MFSKGECSSVPGILGLAPEAFGSSRREGWRCLFGGNESGIRFREQDQVWEQDPGLGAGFRCSNLGELC